MIFFGIACMLIGFLLGSGVAFLVGRHVDKKIRPQLTVLDPAIVAEVMIEREALSRLEVKQKEGTA